MRFKKVTPISELEGKEIHFRDKNGKGADYRGNYVVEYEYDVDVLEPGAYTVEITGYGELKTTPIKILRDKNFSKLHNNFLKDKVVKFLEKEQQLRSLGMEIVKRCTLLHGPPGSGKTHEINNAVMELLGPNGISFSVSMSKVDIGSFASFLRYTDPPKGLDKVIIVIEDLGGGETPDLGVRTMPSSDELLAFLDGNGIPSNWRHIPIIIFSTTNYPKLFLANLIDRPGRFDEVIEVNYPSGDLLVEYAEDFMGQPLPDFAKAEVLKGDISIAHVKDACIRYIVYGDPIHTTVVKMKEWSAKVKKTMEKKEM